MGLGPALSFRFSLITTLWVEIKIARGRAPGSGSLLGGGYAAPHPEGGTWGSVFNRGGEPPLASRSGAEPAPGALIKNIIFS